MAKTMIVVSDEARMAMFKFSQATAAPGCAMQSPGEIAIELSDDVLARLDALRMAGESYSDVIVRVFATQGGLN